MSERPPTPTGWSDTDWIKKLQDDEENPLACLHINQGSFDAAADAYEEEYKMSKRTAMDIADALFGRVAEWPTRDELATTLRQQHAEIERQREMLTDDHEALWEECLVLRKYVGNNMLMSDFRNVDEMRAEIERLTKERDAAIANASALTQHLTQVIGDHNAPSDCYSSGPMFGDARDAICPACAALHFLSNQRASVNSGYGAAIAAAVAAEREEHMAKIDRITALNSALTAKANVLVIANARLDEKISALTAEREACARICGTSLSLEEATYLIRARSAK